MFILLRATGRVGLPVKAADSAIQRNAVFNEPLLTRLSGLVLHLHHSSLAWPKHAFQERAFELLREVIAFDSGMWGTTSNDSHLMHSVHLDHQPREMIERYVAGYQDLDPVLRRAREAPGTTINLSDASSREELCASRMHPEFISPWRME